MPVMLKNTISPGKAVEGTTALLIASFGSAVVATSAVAVMGSVFACLTVRY